MKSEAAIQSEIRKRASQLGVFLWRNNVGACETAEGRIIRYGLANDSVLLSKQIKSSDLVGWTAGGRFVSVEVKREGWEYPRTPSDREKAQAKWINLVKDNGGLAGFATCVKDFEEILGHNR